MYFGHHYWGMHLFWWIFWAVAIVALLAWILPAQPSRRDNAIEALARQYATGQITEEEYRHRVEVLASAATVLRSANDGRSSNPPPQAPGPSPRPPAQSPS